MVPMSSVNRSDHDTSHGACGKTWRQRGNRTGHCSGERWSAVGLTVWDSNAVFRSRGDSLPDESAIYSRGVASDDLPNLVSAQSLPIQAGRLRVPVNRGMSEVVFLGSKSDKVLGSIISPVPVDVVDLLFANDPTGTHPVLVGLDVAVGSDFPPKADVAMGGGITTRLAIGHSLAGVEISRRRAVSTFPAGAAELLLSSADDRSSARDAGLFHVAILQIAALCHETFEGEKLFDAHRVTLDDGTRGCADPRSMEWQGEPLRIENGTWRGPRMDAEARKRYRAA